MPLVGSTKAGSFFLLKCTKGAFQIQVLQVAGGGGSGGRGEQGEKKGEEEEKV